MIIFIGHSESDATTWRRNRSVLSYQGLGVMERDWFQRDKREFWRVMGEFYTFTVVVITWCLHMSMCKTVHNKE